MVWLESITGVRLSHLNMHFYIYLFKKTSNFNPRLHQIKTGAPQSERQRSTCFFQSRKRGITQNYAPCYTCAYCLLQDVFEVSFEYLERFLSNGPRLKFLHDEHAEDEHADAVNHLKPLGPDP